MQENTRSNATDHLANERTFLAWLRTAIGIMAFGFVVVKFSLFVKQLSIVLGKPVVGLNKGDSNLLGISLVAIGALATALAWARYDRTRKRIDQGDYCNSPLLIYVITGVVLVISLLLIIYLIASI
jgi:putative membrane protein